VRRALCLVAMGLILALAGCGKPGSPLTPKGSPYPRIYPNPGLTAPEADEVQPAKPDADKTPSFSPNGAYIDPSVQATDLAQSSRVQPGSSLPYARSLDAGPLGPQELQQPTQSPLPPVESQRPDPESGEP